MIYSLLPIFVLTYPSQHALRIIQSLYGISIHQTSHIQYNILAQWFPYASEKVNSAPTPSYYDTTI